jgi:acyl transferase domain-containing protein
MHTPPASRSRSGFSRSSSATPTDHHAQSRNSRDLFSNAGDHTGAFLGRLARRPRPRDRSRVRSLGAVGLPASEQKSSRFELYVRGRIDRRCSGFDAGFFAISPREAALMDPQHRLLLEMSWETFENAGIRPGTVRGSDCGVYVGISTTDYSWRMADDMAAIDSSFATGNTSSIAANRLSYFFDLRGPSMAIDTACSSSLVAFHQACRAIVSGEITQALAGAVSLHLHPLGFVSFSKASMLSRQGRCRVFDASADGYVRSEGGGVFLLKDYDRAVADGNPILALVAHSAVNTDGRKSGITVPSSAAQASLLAGAYLHAGIDPADIDYIEAHGTGTAVGDPIETRALGEAWAAIDCAPTRCPSARSRAMSGIWKPHRASPDSSKRCTRCVTGSSRRTSAWIIPIRRFRSVSGTWMS